MENRTNVPRSMRAIVRKADGGDLKAMYQLALFLKEGRYFEQDEAKSES
jgi:TPR repeat protein